MTVSHLSAETNVFREQQGDNGSGFDKEWAQVAIKEVNDVFFNQSKAAFNSKFG